MQENNDQINLLLDKLEILLKRQDNFLREINQLKGEINILKNSQTEAKSETKLEVKTDHTVTEVDIEFKKETVTPIVQKQERTTYGEQPKYSSPKASSQPKVKSDIEKFIGENLINKIGILI